MTGLLIAHELLCMVLIICIFGRSVRSTDQVLIGIRISFTLLWTAACIAMAAPVVWCYEPQLVDVILLGAFTLVQVTTSLHWDEGVPRQYLREEYRPQRRTTDRKTA